MMILTSLFQLRRCGGGWSRFGAKNCCLVNADSFYKGLTSTLVANSVCAAFTIRQTNWTVALCLSSAKRSARPIAGGASSAACASATRPSCLETPYRTWRTAFVDGRAEIELGRVWVCAPYAWWGSFSHLLSWMSWLYCGWDTWLCQCSESCIA